MSEAGSADPAVAAKAALQATLENVKKAQTALDSGNVALAWNQSFGADKKLAEALILLAGMAPPNALARAMDRADGAVRIAASAASAGTHTPNAIAKLRARLKAVSEQVLALRDGLGPIRAPSFVFDPAAFDVIAHVVATALLAQPSHPLNQRPVHWGSGIYAIFYKGDLPFYASISGTKTPIYVGSAGPKSHTATTPEDQGNSLVGRLMEHQGSIDEVERYPCGNLKVSDFEYRYLVVKSGWELAAENYLIRYFKPLWNKETKVCTGIGKHGDASSTRANRRSRWDTVHPGRPWTLTLKTKDNAKTAAEIESAIIEHLKRHPPRDLQITDIIS